MNDVKRYVIIGGVSLFINSLDYFFQKQKELQALKVKQKKLATKVWQKAVKTLRKSHKRGKK
jgi:hypothetical protein